MGTKFPNIIDDGNGTNGGDRSYATKQEMDATTSQLDTMATLVSKKVVPIMGRDTITASNKSTANQTGTIKTFVSLPSDCNIIDIAITYQNIFRSGNSLLPNTNTIDIKSSIEINGTRYPIYFNGERIKTVGAGSSIQSDKVPVIISASDTIFIYTYFDVGLGGSLPTGVIHLGSNLNSGRDGFSAGVDYTDSGVVETNIGNLSTYSFFMLTGTPNIQLASTLLIGDSIMSAGDYDELTYEFARTTTGFCSIKLKREDIPYIKSSCGGETSQHMLDNLYCRGLDMCDVNNVICNYGSNDLTYGGTFETIKTSLIKLWSYFSAKGIKVYQTTITPKTTSTDNYLTLENQTKEGGSFETNRLLLNEWIKNNALNESNKALSGVIDVASLVEIDGKWKVYTVPLVSGAVEWANANQIDDSNINIPDHTLTGTGMLKIVSGTGAGQDRLISFNTNNSIGVYDAFDPAPDTTSHYEAYYIMTNDGTHPTSIGATNMGEAILIDLL